MYLVSTGKTTILSSFEDLETKSTYQHQNADTTDFQFGTNSEVFVEVNKKSGLEVMRVKAINEKDLEIQRVLKLKIENGYCVACARHSLEEIALGLSNGDVRIYNYATTELLHKYVGEKLNGVVFLDYNSSDEYILAVQEKGIINIYGRKTGVKLESINIDSNCTLSRFHPNKRFQLAVASYKGAVTTYDLSAKRKVFHSIDSHKAPCRDICMCANKPDTLISVGYDCVVNIFDTRRKGKPINMTHSHPLSTATLSDCGNFLCVGCLKGELTTYDIRNLRTPLTNKKVHDCGVNRVAFVPTVVNRKQSDSVPNASCASNTTYPAIAELQSTQKPTEKGNAENKCNIDSRKSLTNLRGSHDSFCDLFDMQTSKGIEKISYQQTTHGRDSFDWETLARKPSTVNRGSLLNFRSSSANVGDCSVENVRTTYSFGDSFDKKLSDMEELALDSNSEVQSSTTNNTPLREQNCIGPHVHMGKLKKITEEHQESEQKFALNTSSGSDKENPHIHLELHRQVKSTPIGSSPHQKISNHIYPNFNEFQKLIDNLRENIDARFNQLELNLQMDAERNKWDIFTQSFNLWQQQINNTEDIRNALSVLLQTDPFVTEFSRLKEENKTLKAQLEHLLIKKK